MIISCQNTTEPVVENAKAESKSGGTSSESGGGNPGSTGTDNGDVPVAIGDDGTVSVGARNLVSLGEGTEVLDSVSYTVKKYADVYVESPYFYTYYKLYYSNNILRRIYIYYHDFGCEMDYKYTEFVEHECGGIRSTIHHIYTYYENGKLETVYTDGKDQNGLQTATERKYDLNRRLINLKNYRNNILTNETRYEYD